MDIEKEILLLLDRIEQLIEQLFECNASTLPQLEE